MHQREKIDHGAARMHNGWYANPYVFLEATNTKGPWPSHFYLLPYYGFGSGVKMSLRDKMFVNMTGLFY